MAAIKIDPPANKTPRYPPRGFVRRRPNRLYFKTIAVNG
jgi:hypothetical protein